MTLSRFLRDYLYIPLGGSRGLPVQVAALFATMALGGLWHGAGLDLRRLGRAARRRPRRGVLWRKRGSSMPSPVGWALTFAFVALTWRAVPRRTFEAALRANAGPVRLRREWLLRRSSGGRWRSAAAVAMIGPAAWTFVHKLPPQRWIAVALRCCS